MTTMLSNPALTAARQPLAPEFVEFLAAFDGNQLTFHRKAFRTGFASITEDMAQYLFEFTQDRRRELIVPWSESVERELFRRGITMDKPEDEAVRGGKLMLAALAYLDLSFGASLVDPAIRQTLTRRFGDVLPLRNLLGPSPEAPIDLTTPAFVDCLSLVDNTIDGYGNSLILEFGYPNREAYAILLGAVYCMFDKRYLLSTKHVVLADQQ